MPIIKRILFLLFLTLSLCNQDLLPSVTTSPNSLSANSYAYYTFTVPQAVARNSSHLTFDTVNVGEDPSDPDIYISTESQQPAASSSQWSCATYGQDVCVVPKAHVAGGGKFYVAVHCVRACQYKLTVRLADEKELRDGEGFSGELEASESQIFWFAVGRDDSTNSVGVSLSLDTANTSMVRMFVSRGDQLPTSKSPVRGVPTWLGLAARVYKSDPLFCTDCRFKVLVTANVQTSYTITFKTSQGVVKVTGDKLDTYEIVRKGERNCYEYNIRTPEETMQVVLNVYSGNSDIFVNPGRVPHQPVDFAFYSTQCLSEMITITPKQRQERNAATGNYYVCIYGRSPSAYNLLIYSEVEKEEKEIEIVSGRVRTMNVKAGETKFFRYRLNNKEVPRNIGIYLISITGNADLYIKQCKMRRNEEGEWTPPCKLTEATLTDPDVEKSTLAESVDKIQTQVSTAECQGENQCVYLIAVKGLRNARFSLSVLGENAEEVPLAEGVPVFGHAKLYQYNHYSFHVEDPDTTTIRVQLTSLSGDADLFLSRVNPYCGCVLAERGSQLENFLPDTLLFYKERDGDLNTTYHISVLGFTDATYSLYYTTSSPNKEIRPTTLYDGQPQSGVINGTSPERSIALYQFTVDFGEEDAREIWISLTPITGKFQVFVAHNSTPSPGNFTWQLPPQQTQLRIPVDDSNYRRHGTYYVLVQRVGESASASAFTVKYYTGAFLHALLEGQSEIGSLLENNFAYYKYSVANLITSVTITLTPFSGNPDLFISINDSNKMPSKQAYDYVSSTLGADSITITAQEYYTKNKVCSKQLAGCSIYIGVVCSSPQCSYTIQLSRKETAVAKLLDGVMQYGSAAFDSPSNFVVNAEGTSDVVVTVYPKKGSVVLYASAVARAEYIRNQSPPLPTREKHQFASTSLANAHTIVVPKSALDACGADCKVYVSVHQVADGTAASEYMILSATNVTHLADTIPIIDLVPEQSYKYYFFDVPCTDCTLSISLTPLSQGDPDIYVNKGRERLPTTSSSNFKASRYRGEFLQISKSDPYFAAGKESMQGAYTIGVHGQQNCTYSLAVTTSAAMVQELSLGVPVKTEAKQGTISYFVFYSWKDASIRFSLSIHFGRALLRANAVKDLREVDVISVLPASELKSTWSSSHSNSLNSLTISKDDPKFIKSGVYLLAVEAAESSTYETIVEYDDDYHYTYLTLLEPYRIHIDAGEVKRVAFVVQNKAKITVSIYNIYGNIEGKLYTEKEGAHFWPIDTLKLTVSPGDPHFKLGTYYASFAAKENSEFIVTVGNSADTMFTLGEGLPMRSEVWGNSSAYFYYPLPMMKMQADNVGRFSVSVNFLDPVANPKVHIKRVTKEDPALPDAGNSDIVIGEDADTGLLGGTFNFSQVAGTSVAIAVSGEVETGKAAFDIAAWTAGVVLITPKHKYTRELKHPGESHIYEVNINKASQLLVEVIPCVGEVEFTVSKNLAQLNDRKYDLKQTELSKGRLFGRISTPAGNYYIAVRGIGISETMAKYTIRTIVMKSKNEKEVEDYYMENYGNINYVVERGKVGLKWGKVWGKVNGTNKEIKVKYKIYVTDNDRANMYTVCGIKEGGVKKAEDTKKNSYSYKIPDKYLNKRIVINVMAEIKGDKKQKHEKREKESLVYNPITVEVQGPTRAGRIIFLLTIVGAVAAAGVALCYYVKYRRAKRRLEYEVQDARYLSQISSEAPFPTEKSEAYTEMNLQS